MNTSFLPPFAEEEIQEKGASFAPHFNKDGLLTAVVMCKKSSDLLMVAHMDAEAISLTLKTGIAHFWSRSRKTLWKKGESSGNFFEIKEVFIDCDQDVLLFKVLVTGGGAACHTGERSCFYRQIKVGRNGETELVKRPASPLRFI